MAIFKLPDLGEGLPDAEIVEWHVKLGEVVALDQKLVSMETAKAVVEVPSPFSGKIVKLFGNPGDVIKTSSPLVEFEPQENAATVAGKLPTSSEIFKEPKISSSQASHSVPSEKPKTVKTNIKATPAIRALAERLQVNLAWVEPTGPNQTITSQDVEKAAKSPLEGNAFEPLKGSRRTMARIMSQSNAEVVPVTVMDDAKLLNWTENEDISVRLIQAIIQAVAKEPALNAWYDTRMEARQLFKELHLGLAVDTEEGLMVPVIKNANHLDAQKLRGQIDELKKKAKERRFSPDDLKGATFTLSNFGKYAGRYSNPIIVPPMVAILAAGKWRQEIIAHQELPTLCTVLPLSLTFDHRAVTGGEATRFLGAVIDSLEQG